MTKRSKSPSSLSARKLPKQDRSRQMQQDILEASLRVFRKEGPLRFTTTRVAKAAGISVGSLYQYFPNKGALVYALHCHAMEQGWNRVQGILDAESQTPREKILEIAEWFFQEESNEVRGIGPALKDAEMFFEKEVGRAKMELVTFERFIKFVRAAGVPTPSGPEARFRTQLLISTLKSVGKDVASQQLPAREVRRWARATSNMVADALDME